MTDVTVIQSHDVLCSLGGVFLCEFFFPAAERLPRIMFTFTSI